MIMKKENSKSANLSEDIFSSLPTTNKQSIRRGKTDVCIDAGTFIETDIDHIDWPEGITHIGHDAFAHCGNLESVIIPDTVTQLGERAFIEKACRRFHWDAVPNVLFWRR